MKNYSFTFLLFLEIFLVGCNTDSPQAHVADTTVQSNNKTGNSSALPASEQSAKPLTDDERIKQIKAWYSQIQEKAKTEGMAANCSDVKWQTVEQEETFNQKAKRCSFTG